MSVEVENGGIYARSILSNNISVYKCSAHNLLLLHNVLLVPFRAYFNYTWFRNSYRATFLSTHSVSFYICNSRRKIVAIKS